MPPVINDLPTWALLLLALLTGGGATQLINRFWLSKKEETDAAHQLRDELRQGLAQLTTRVDKLQREADEWRERYFKLLQEHTDLSIQYQRVRAELDLINPKPALYTRELAPTPTPTPTPTAS